MGNRMIKDSIRTSRKINQLTDFQFRVWVYLITYVDDYGRGSADPELIKGFVFPRRKRISESDIEKALAELAGMGCISLYNVDGESYFCFPNWSKHQRVQSKYSQFPAPEDGDKLNLTAIRREQRNSTASHGESRNSTASHGESRNSTASHGESRNSTASHGESPIELELEVEPEVELEIEAYASCVEPETASTLPADFASVVTPPIILLPLNDGTNYPVSHEQCQEWAGLYPAVDVIQQLRNMRGWLDSKPSRRKTKRGIRTFITGWLAREQDRGGSRLGAARAPAYGGNVFMDMLREEEGREQS